MITVKPLEGINPRTRKPSSPGVDGIFHNERQIGICDPKVGGGAALYLPVSEALEDEIREALDQRDGEPRERIIALHPRDPRRT